jgi:hypothetical protein
MRRPITDDIEENGCSCANALIKAGGSTITGAKFWRTISLAIDPLDGAPVIFRPALPESMRLSRPKKINCMICRAVSS